MRTVDVTHEDLVGAIIALAEIIQRLAECPDVSGEKVLTAQEKTYAAAILTMKKKNLASLLSRFASSLPRRQCNTGVHV